MENEQQIEYLEKREKLFKKGQKIQYGMNILTGAIQNPIKHRSIEEFDEVSKNYMSNLKIWIEDVRNHINDDIDHDILDEEFN